MGSLRLVASTLALAAVACLAPLAAAETEIYVTANTLRTVNVEASTTLPVDAAALWRESVDADGSGSVSQEEASIVISVIDALVYDAALTDVDAYKLAWARQNSTGAAGVTPEGRATLASFAFVQASAVRWKATFDGLNGSVQRAAISFTGLTGLVSANSTLFVLFELVYDFPALDQNEPVHRLSVALPPGLRVALTVGGALQVVEAEYVDATTKDAAGSKINGTTTATAPVFLVKERAVSNEAFAIAFVAIVVPTALVALVAVYALPRMRVPDPELIVEPKYK